MLEVNIEKIVPVTDARDSLNKIVDEVSGSDEMYVLTVNGKPAAVVVGVHHLEKLTGKSAAGLMAETNPETVTATETVEAPAPSLPQDMPGNAAEETRPDTAGLAPTPTDPTLAQHQEEALTYSSPVETPIEENPPQDSVSAPVSNDAMAELFPDTAQDTPEVVAAAPTPQQPVQTQDQPNNPDDPFVTPDNDDLNTPAPQA